MTSKTVGDLINYVWENFAEHDGERKAFFEIPQVKGDDLRVVYVSYVGRGDSEAGLIDWMMDIFTRLKKLGGVQWYWRLEECIQLTQNEGEPAIIRTRIAVLDKDLNVVVLPDMLHEEGGYVTRVKTT